MTITANIYYLTTTCLWEVFMTQYSLSWVQLSTLVISGPFSDTVETDEVFHDITEKWQIIAWE
jgi:hypothetical protein